jgi:hypothetical protein
MFLEPDKATLVLRADACDQLRIHGSCTIADADCVWQHCHPQLFYH